MKITIYELLGMIKDNKAPKKVIYDRLIWNFEEDNLYYCDNVWLDDYCNISQVLNDEVEIIESQEYKIPKNYIIVTQMN